MIKTLLLIGLGGFAGSVLRYLVSYAVTSGGTVAGLPVATMLVNIAGSFLIGLLLYTTNPGLFQFAAIGFCGGFTTFSTFSAEMLRMVRDSNYSVAALYALVSVVLCLLAVWAGFFIAGKIKI